MVVENINGILDKALDIYADRLKKLAALVRTDLMPVYREKLVVLITIEVHSRDIIEETKAAGVTDANDFEWTKRLRYFIEDNKVWVRQNDANIEYGYEYLCFTPPVSLSPTSQSVSI